jgi:hypothetical protein
LVFCAPIFIAGRKKIKTKRKKKKIKKNKMGRGRTVHIVDNGGVPFRVHLSSAALTNEGQATISAHVPGSDPASYAEWGTVQYARARVGLCPTERGARGARVAPLWWHKGNSILLHTSDDCIVYIGTSIKEFRPCEGDTIVAFVSPMGNSAVPYPYAIGRTHTYLMEEAACIDNATLVRVMASAPRAVDPYEAMYGYDLTAGADAPRKFESAVQRMRGARRNRKALALPMRVLAHRA